jgi:hypothetical protein
VKVNGAGSGLDQDYRPQRAFRWSSVSANNQVWSPVPKIAAEPEGW